MVLKSIPAWAAFAAAVIVTACGGGGGGGIGGTGSPVATSYGGVTAIGSVWVNGVRFNVDSASIQDRGGANVVPKAGMVVQVDGSIANAQASKVTVEGSLKGPIEAVGTDQITVMGQVVRIDDTTCGDAAPIKPQRPGCGTLVVPGVGTGVEVHGLQVSDGVIQAGYIRTVSTPPFAVKGYVKNLGAGTFNIGSLVVNYQGVVDLSDVGGALNNGQFVEVTGNACAGNPCGTLTATRLSNSGVKATNGLPAEVEGYVGAIVDASHFNLGTQAVTTSAATVYVGGTAADILAGAKVEVEGSFNGGALFATKIRFLDSIRIEASVANRVGNTLTFTNLPNLSATANALTDLGSNLTSVTVLQTGDFVRLRARPAAGGGLVITRIELRNGGGGGNHTILQAPVENNDGISVRLLGIDIAPAAGGAAYSSSVPGTTVNDRTSFFAAARPPKIVKARLVPASITADEFELQEN